MPIEIRELVIKATVEQEGAGAGSGGGGTGGSGNVTPQEELIKSCVAKVLEILKQKDER